MKIEKQKQNDILHFKIAGRVDSEWATHLSDEIKEAMHAGDDTFLLDMENVTFMSSAGVRVLLLFYKQLRNIGGSLTVTNPSDTVRSLIEMSGLKALFETPEPEASSEGSIPESVQKGSTTFEVYPSDSDAPLSYSLIGNPAGLTDPDCSFDKSDRLTTGKSTMALGLGAFGTSHDDCRDLFGEFLAVSGSAAYAPPAGKGTPDYLLASGNFVPDVQVLYGVVCEGTLPGFLRFESADDSVPLSELMSECMALTGHKKAAVVMIAESAGLIGASLRKSPLQRREDEKIFDYPGIRSWLSFSPELVYDKSMAVVAGVISNDNTEEPFMRTIGPGSDMTGHFHSAVFSYTPLARGRLPLEETVSTVFKNQSLQAVLHLLSDDLESGSGAESEFRRGAIWIGGLE